MRLRIVLGIVIVAVLAWFAAPFVGLDVRSIVGPKPAQPTETIVEPLDEGPSPIAKLNVFDDDESIDDAGFDFSRAFTGNPEDSGSLEQLRQAVDDRLQLGLSVLGNELDQLKIGPESTKEEILIGRSLYQQFGLLAIYAGKLEDATLSFQRALELAEFIDASTREVVELHNLLGITALRRGEVENGLGRDRPLRAELPPIPSSLGTRKEGYGEAIEQFEKSLRDEPRDRRVRWLLNVAYLYAGEYPDRVPPELLIALPKLEPNGSGIVFTDVSKEAGLMEGGPNLAGIGLFDDFNGDHSPDLLIGSMNTEFGAVFYRNDGAGKFIDETGPLGPESQVYVRNGAAADYDNDGKLDVFLARGGDESPLRPSLLKGVGDGTFVDVTSSAGLIEPIASEAACWGDYDGDGFVDLFVAGEYRSPKLDPDGEGRPDPRNPCRLYHNESGKFFKEVAREAGVDNLECAKGAAWGDFDDDGDLDLFVANLNAPSRLYRNEGSRFQDVAEAKGVTGLVRASSCWFWDFDEDGDLDLFVNDAGGTTSEVVAEMLDPKLESSHHPKLFQNLGEAGFVESGAALGLKQATVPWGCNFADVDDDGFLDLFLSRGSSSLGSFLPSRLFRNIDGKGFVETAQSARLSTLQKAHSVSFADYDFDGDLDLFLQCGGIAPGDQSYNRLLRNDSPKRAFLSLKLVGVQSNRAALGARIKAVFQTAGGERTIHRIVGTDSSLGGNSLVQTLGLFDAKRVDQIEIRWHGSGTIQSFDHVPADQFLEVTEGVDALKTLSAVNR